MSQLDGLLRYRDRGGAPGFDAGSCRAAGMDLAGHYAAASPFPHIVIDDLVDPALLAGLAAHFPDRTGKRFFDRDQERFKYQFGPEDIGDGGLRTLLAELNGAAFLGFLEALTGIEGLVPDPWYLGGGLHETLPGGHLSVHADFNRHPRLKLRRRLNLLIYLNEGWQPEWGGDLELWDRAMHRCEVRVAPLLGRAVIFNTDADSHHGHPDPLRCPPDRSRRSMATYYYTAFPVDEAESPERTTVFRLRPGSGDKHDRRVAIDHFIQDWVPLRLQRYARKLNRFR